MYIVKFLKIIKKIFSSKLIFKNPEPKSVLFWGRPRHSTTFQKKNEFVNFKDINFLDVWGESYYFNILIKCFFKLKFTLKDYSEEFIKITNPKLIISFLDNYETFYLIKKKASQKKILIQSAFRTGEDIVFKKNASYTNKDNKVDYIFTHNKNIKNKFQILLKCKNYTIGSLFCNNVPVQKNKKIFDVLFISTFRPDNDFQISKGVYLSDWLCAEKELIQHIYKFTKKNKKKLFILTSNKKDQKKELNFFKDALGDDKSYKILKRNIYDMSEPYKIVDQSKIVTGIDSTLLYESFGRGTKTIFFDIRPSNKFLSRNRHFGWPKKYPRSGAFWTNENKFVSVSNIMNRMMNFKKKKWDKIKIKYQDDIMAYNSNNKILKDFLNSFK